MSDSLEGNFSDNKYSDLKEEEAYHRIKKYVTKGKSGVEHPVAIVLGGQPGGRKK